jgi:hypothetical protein
LFLQLLVSSFHLLYPAEKVHLEELGPSEALLFNVVEQGGLVEEDVVDVVVLERTKIGSKMAAGHLATWTSFWNKPKRIIATVLSTMVNIVQLFAKCSKCRRQR